MCWDVLEHCFVMNEVFWRFGEFRRYRPDQELEIYNFRVVPELQISKEVDFLINKFILHCFGTFVFCGWHGQTRKS